jgi:hypothetical protein
MVFNTTFSNISVSFRGIVYTSGAPVLDTTLCDKVSQLLAAGRWFPPGSPVPPIKLTEILLKVVLNTITLTLLSLLYEGQRYIYCFQIYFPFSTIGQNMDGSGH